MNPFKDAFNILKMNWKLLALLNALYFCVIVIGATLALMSPSLHLSMVQLIGAETIAGPSGNPAPASPADSLVLAGNAFFKSFFMNTLAMITLPSLVLPIWAPIIGAARFFIWGVAYVSPLDGVLTPGKLIPQYVAMLLEGEAYVVAIFACVRQFTAALDSAGLGFRRALIEYTKAVFDNLKLLVIVALLLAAAALYQAFLVPVLNGFL